MLEYDGPVKIKSKVTAEQLDRWPVPEKPRGKPLGLWNMPEEQQKPAWQPWRERWEKIQKRKEERRKKKTWNI